MCCQIDEVVFLICSVLSSLGHRIFEWKQNTVFMHVSLNVINEISTVYVSVERVCMLNVINADYVDYVLGVQSKMAEDGNSGRRIVE